MPSSAKARDAIFKLMDGTGQGTVCDLGSGWGNLIIPLARQNPNRPIIGYEISWVPWLVSVLLKHGLRLNNLTIYRKDFLNHDLCYADVLICYLHTQTMTALGEKLMSEPRKGGVLISNNFGLHGFQPELTEQIADFYRSPIYRYRLNDMSRDVH